MVVNQDPLFLFFQKYKRYVTIFSLVLVVIFFYLIFKLLATKPAQPKLPEPLKVVSVVPENNVFKSYFSTEVVKLSFNYLVIPKNLEISISPFVETRILDQDKLTKTISIIPLKGWKENQEYTIIIKKESKSANGVALENDFDFKFKWVVPEPDDPDFNLYIDEKEAPNP